jgi:hypothetical protein
MYIQCMQCVIVVVKKSLFFVDFLINTIKKLPTLLYAGTCVSSNEF